MVPSTLLPEVREVGIPPPGARVVHTPLLAFQWALGSLRPSRLLLVRQGHPGVMPRLGSPVPQEALPWVRLLLGREAVVALGFCLLRGLPLLSQQPRHPLRPLEEQRSKPRVRG